VSPRLLRDLLPVSVLPQEATGAHRACWAEYTDRWPGQCWQIRDPAAPLGGGEHRRGTTSLYGAVRGGADCLLLRARAPTARASLAARASLTARASRAFTPYNLNACVDVSPCLYMHPYRLCPAHLSSLLNPFPVTVHDTVATHHGVCN